MRQPNRHATHVTPIVPPPRRRRLAVAAAALLVTGLALPSSFLAAAGGAHTARAADYTVANQGGPEPGRRPNNRALLVNNRTVTPVGKQSSLGDLPLNAVLSPDGSHLLVANSGAGEQSLQVVSTATGGAVQTIRYDAPNSVFYGLAYSPGGTRAYASGGGSNVIHTYDVAPSGTLSATTDISLGLSGSLYPDLGTGPWPAGLSLGADGTTLYVADNLANAVSVVDTTGATAPFTIPVGSFPYTTLADPMTNKVYVSNWGDNTVSVINTSSNTVAATVTVGLANTVGKATSHPSAMALSPDGFLFVALSNSDAIAVVDTRGSTPRLVRRLSDASYPGAPLSSSPQGLTVSPDGTRLYVANAGDNAVAVYALDAANGSARRLGRIPTAWYPTSVAASIDGRNIYVTNGMGYGAGPNWPKGNDLYPNPTRRTPPIVAAVTGYNDSYCNCTFDKYSGSMVVGTLSTVPVPGAGTLRVDSGEVATNNRENDAAIDDRDAGNPIPTAGEPAGASPIKHVIYIIKENRTYDQVLGDAPVGDGDASLTLFGRRNTPNIHALAARFGLLDNFYADAQVSADGHNWTTSANASDYNEKMWPQDYSPGLGRNRGYDFEGATTINLSPGGYLWDAAARAGISYRDYGEFTINGGSPTAIPTGSSCAGPVATSYISATIPSGSVLCFGATTVYTANTPALVGHIDPQFRGYDNRYSDDDRVTEWAHDNGFLSGKPNLAAFEIMRLPNDHTQGTRAGYPTPQAYVAQNDAAVGRLVDIVSHSPLWASTAIFVTEDDAQNGPDHVDAQRTESLVISPYTAHDGPFVDHTVYDTAAMLRTMELILGLQPLSQFDANAIPMWRSFGGTPDTSTYSAISATVPISQVNTPSSYGALQSAQIDFSQEDRAPMGTLNHILWHAVKGAYTPYPAPSGTSGARGKQDPD